MAKIKTPSLILQKVVTRIAGFDMGSSNTAATILDIKIGHNSGKVLKVTHRHTQMMSTIKDLTQDGFGPAHDSFATYFETWLDEWQPDVLMAERFISRGLRGSQGEKVSAMLFTMATICRARGIIFRLVSAQSWKNTFCRRHFSKERLEGLYRFVKKKNAHRVDATLIALYAADPYGSYAFIGNGDRLQNLIDKVKP